MATKEIASVALLSRNDKRRDCFLGAKVTDPRATGPSGAISGIFVWQPRRLLRSLRSLAMTKRLRASSSRESGRTPLAFHECKLKSESVDQERLHR